MIFFVKRKTIFFNLILTKWQSWVNIILQSRVIPDCFIWEYLQKSSYEWQ